MRKPKPPKVPLHPRSPRLSTDLRGPRHPHRCQACNATGELYRFREHDHNDQPETILVVLCGACAEKLIKPHPRLYHLLEPFEPASGAMQICVDCVWRRGVSCKHPDSHRSGGKGIAIKYAHPVVSAMVNFGGGRVNFYTEPPSACYGRDVDAAADAPAEPAPDTTAPVVEW